ncbi:MAG: hypothetical protein IT495_17615 [Gammaproteobacteria bacterium]|nr:hypothetical protein [Gammaproteobacteria bacterium]
MNYSVIRGGGATWAYAHNIPARKQALYYALSATTFSWSPADRIPQIRRYRPKSADPDCSPSSPRRWPAKRSRRSPGHVREPPPFKGFGVWRRYPLDDAASRPAMDDLP